MGIASDLAMMLDPVLLARRCGIEADPWQAELLRSSDRQILLNCARQTGKSTMVALLAVHQSLLEPSLSLIFSPTLRQSSETLRKTKDLLGSLEVNPASETGHSIELENGSRIASLPGTQATVRGYSKASLVIIDEAAFISDTLIAAARPMVAVSGGRLIMLSTPYGQRGAFYEAWSQGGADWRRIKVTAEMCPRISPEFLATERRQLGPYQYASEYECEFLGMLDSVFRFEDIERAFTPEVEPLFGERDSITDLAASETEEAVISENLTSLFAA